MLRVDKNGNRTHYSIEDDNFILKNYLTMPPRHIAKALHTSASGIRYRMSKMNLTIPKDILDKRVKNSHFKKGLIPHSKGKKQIEWMSKESVEKLKKTQFKKNNIPHNSFPVGKEVIWNNKGVSYIMVKVPEYSQLVYKHIYLWEKENGKVKKGYNVIFKDKNHLNCVIENLECISNQELMLRNSKTHDYPAELIQEYAKISELKSTIKKIEDGKNRL